MFKFIFCEAWNHNDYSNIFGTIVGSFLGMMGH